MYCGKRHQPNIPKASILWLAGVNLPVTLEAQSGANVTVECSYPTTLGNVVRHFCREDGKFTCANLISMFSFKRAARDRLSMREGKEHGTYAVTIFAVRRNDSGRYRCEVEQYGDNITRQCLTQIRLVVSGKRASFPVQLNDQCTRGSGAFCRRLPRTSVLAVASDLSLLFATPYLFPHARSC